jgi:hypothetical protein
MHEVSNVYVDYTALLHSTDAARNHDAILPMNKAYGEGFFRLPNQESSLPPDLSTLDVRPLEVDRPPNPPNGQRIHG